MRGESYFAMTSSYTLIRGGTLYDPAHRIAGEVRDVWIEGGKVVEPPTSSGTLPSRVIDASGLVVMPGGVDMHCHIAGGKVNTSRCMRPEDRSAIGCSATELLRSGTLGSCPSTFITGYRYAGLGYTTAMDAAISPLGARHAHEELADTPCIDRGFFALVGNNHFILEAIQSGEQEQLRDFLGWLLKSTKAYAPKVVNAGGVEVWKHRPTGNATGLDEPCDPFGVSPRQILQSLARAANALSLPHPLHVHCNELGMPGNWRTTLESMKSMEGMRAHFTHAQFHSYGGGSAEEHTLRSQVEPLAEYVNAHANITVDVGQVMFGETTSMTGDGPVGYFLANLTGSKWFSSDLELESGCGVSPMTYRNKSLVHALQWAIGLEWYLMIRDPWQVAMSTDHPNGGSFLAYPEIIRLLMDRSYRDEVLAKCPEELLKRTQLKDLAREYTLEEIAIITRAAPARMLGLAHKGHLGIGADADITIYTPHADKQQMFSLPRFVIKGGEILVEEGDLRHVVFGKTIHAAPQFDAAIETHATNYLRQYSTVSPRSFAIRDDEVPDRVMVE
ncbi:formylmethanofuran dehydrogenase subunit A [Pirellula staleyi DSM 6068]|uniref:Formylmethanofuran dehydrogenase subunit A n=1 Tax=Pirellula staleyi (strain ATCC 27377 / DSM 6068 / ICPB 4128) TaxID=530564 RepID=D2R092_PIRSD|nr:formylmethanofuran dehydrogenase subunit A [Pirellula staleyi DSM 6068]